jgi:hypothetical protein
MELVMGEVESQDLGVDLECIFQAACPVAGGVRTDQLLPVRRRTVARPVQIAYREEAPLRSDANRMTRDRWVVLFDDQLEPPGFQTSGSRRWAVT